MSCAGDWSRKDADRAPRVDHVVYLRVFRTDPAQVGPHPFSGCDQVQRLFDLVEYGQGEQVDLGKVGIRHGILVPVHDVAALHSAGTNGYQRRNGRVAQDHAPDVLTESLGRIHERRPKLDEVAPSRGRDFILKGRQRQHLFLEVDGIVGVKLLGKERKVFLGQSQGFPQILDDSFYRVGSDSTGKHSVFRPKVAVHPLQQRVPELSRKVQVYIRQHGHVRGNEALQGEIPLERVDVADADEVSN